MSKRTLKAEKREVVGRKVKKLRRDGVLPANIYGKKVKSLSVQVITSDFQKVYKEAGETGLIELSVGGAKKPVLVHDVQLDPVTDEPLHADFFQVNLKEKVTANVPVEIIGIAPADKSGLGTLVQQVDEIEVEALPADLPDKFEVDVSGLEEVDSAITIADIKVSKKVEVKADLELIVAKVEPLRAEEEEPVVVAEGEGGVETEGEEGEAVDGEKPAEGGETKGQAVKPQEETSKEKS